ncbi:MAG: hypothetical protein B6244_03365 [Candidatus Cloacimonetes bacterium 4572_55]|nr:MAG: hypothetical protein B6244_03365 [Candidatus Cloacimonetes bacterium 4572_55]
MFFILFFSIFFIASCDADSDLESSLGDHKIELIGVHDIDVPEPSGLTLHRDTLWTVSDDTGNIYKLDLQGNTREIITVNGDDPEGVAYDPTDYTLWLVEERTREIVHADQSGSIIERHEIEISGSGNRGFEGVCMDDDHNFYILNEKDPSLFISLTHDFSISEQITLDFNQDYSGLCYDRGRNAFWIVSDESQTICLWSPKNGLLSELIPLSFRKAEGVAYDPINDKIYIVSDSEEKLYVYEYQH